MKTIAVQPFTKPTTASVTVPGSKSYSLRALLISALCDQKFKIHNLLESTDTAAMHSCLLDIKNMKSELFTDESGVTTRFITALACITPGEQIVTGAPGLNRRPINDLVDALRQLGGTIEYVDKDGFPPLKVTSSTLTKNELSISGNISSQYLSALLLIAPQIAGGLEITVTGQQISKPYIDMTTDIMQSFGVRVINNAYRQYKVLAEQQYQAKDYVVEADFSSAAYFFAIAALTGSTITVRGLNPQSKQADIELLNILEAMGSHVERIEDRITVRGSELKPTDINMSDCPDQAMTVAMLAAFADGTSTITGIASLRIKESERVRAVENELAKMGIKTQSPDEDTLIIHGGKPHGALIQTYGDHRIAMSFAVAATKTPDIKITHPEVVNKTFPGFWDELKKITKVDKEVEYIPTKILITGMRGTGKTTIGRLLAGKLRLDFIDVDNYIEKSEGRKIKDIVEAGGWDKFRTLEAQACLDLAGRDNVVISTGGGIVTHPEFQKLKENAFTILLVSSTELLAKRIEGDRNRVELTTQARLPDELEQIWQERKSTYFENADLVVDSIAEPKKVVREIITKL